MIAGIDQAKSCGVQRQAGPGDESETNMLARISSWVRAGGSVPTIVQTSVPEDFQKRLVFYRSQQPPGVIVVDTLEHSGFDAFDPLRGIGVGREGFTV